MTEMKSRSAVTSLFDVRHSSFNTILKTNQLSARYKQIISICVAQP